MQRRGRIKQTISLHDTLAAWTKAARELADALPPGPERDALLRKARRADTASHLQDWLDGIEPPRSTPKLRTCKPKAKAASVRALG
jgi:hypothetical protein